MSEALSRNLGLELVRATEAAALTAGRWMGLNQPVEAEHHAARAMYSVLNDMEMDGKLVIGQERKGNRENTLHSGLPLGHASHPKADVVADPIDGGILLAKGYTSAISAAAIAPRGSMWRPHPAIYMDKIVVGPSVAPVLVPDCLNAPAAWTLALVARASGKAVQDLVVFVLERPRHVDLIQEIRAAGGRVMLRDEGDISGALMACLEDGGVDILLGVGGIPEGLMAACAVKVAGGGMLGRLSPQSEEELAGLKNAGLDTQTLLTQEELVVSDNVYFSATGITDGRLLTGVQYFGERATSNSLVLRGATRTRRRIYAQHLLRPNPDDARTLPPVT